MADKRVGVSMSPACYRALKTYAARFESTMSEVLYKSTKHFIHIHALYSHSVKSLLDAERITITPSADKACSGHLCMTCLKRKECVEGDFLGTWIHDAERFGDWYEYNDDLKPMFNGDYQSDDDIKYKKLSDEEIQAITDGLKYNKSIESIVKVFENQKQISFMRGSLKGEAQFISDHLRPRLGMDLALDVKGLSFARISPENQPCGRPSSEVGFEYITKAIELGSLRFPWVHCSLDGRHRIACEIELVAFGECLFGFLFDLTHSCS